MGYISLMIYIYIYPKKQIERDRIKKTPYNMDIRPIIYSILCTIPNVSYVLRIMSRYQFNPYESHYKIVKNILK